MWNWSLLGVKGLKFFNPCGPFSSVKLSVTPKHYWYGSPPSQSSRPTAPPSPPLCFWVDLPLGFTPYPWQHKSCHGIPLVCSENLWAQDEQPIFLALEDNNKQTKKTLRKYWQATQRKSAKPSQGQWKKILEKVSYVKQGQLVLRARVFVRSCGNSWLLERWPHSQDFSCLWEMKSPGNEAWLCVNDGRKTTA